MAKRRRKKGIKAWLKVNRQGAIVGGIIGVIPLFFPKDINGNLIIPNYIASLGLGSLTGTLFPIVITILLPALGIIIGAFIDSKWKPNK